MSKRSVIQVDTLQRYIRENPDMQNKDIASLILENESVNVSYSTLRQKIGRIRTGAEIAQTQDNNGKKTWDEKNDSATFSYDGRAEIHNLDEALQFSGVDLDIWEVDRHIFNVWHVSTKDNGQFQNVQVKIWFKKRAEAVLADMGLDWDNIRQVAKSVCKTTHVKSAKGRGVGVILSADFHLGAYIDQLVRSPNFNISILCEYLTRSAEIINEKKYKEVHVGLLGDFIESFTGLNHRDSWKGLSKGAFGMNAVILCFEILRDHFLGNIKNLTSVYMVSGNHDRVTDDRNGDQRGEVAEILAYMIDNSFKDVTVKYHAMVINEIIDGISYVFTHGHLPFANKEISKILFDYGKQGLFNVVAMGHTHSRKVTKSTRQRTLIYEDITIVDIDEIDYRRIVAAPMFTGNFFSESLGFSSSAGVTIIENNGKGRINTLDYCL